jgi:uncharacterized protein (DUF362 family)
MAASSPVILVTGSDKREMIRRAIGLLGDAFPPLVADGKRVFVHPNLVSYHRPEANTDVEAVRAVLDHIFLHRREPVPVGDAGVRNTKKALRKLGYETLRRSGNIELVDLNEDETIETYAYTAEMERRPIGFARTVAETDTNIVVVPAKMHSYFGVTLSIKTQVVGSMVVGPTPLGMHFRWPWIHTGYVSGNHTLADVYADFPAQLAVIDGTQAMEGNGPASGETVNLGWVIVSGNPVSADGLASYLMGYNPQEIGYLHHLDEKGLGPIDPEKMNIAESDLKKLRRELKRPDAYPGAQAWVGEQLNS